MNAGLEAQRAEAAAALADGDSGAPRGHGLPASAVNSVPSQRCGRCGEWLPHWCAPLITITRQKWTGRRIVTITDRRYLAATPIVFAR